MTCKIWDTAVFYRVVHIPNALYRMLNKWKDKTHAVEEDGILHFIPARLKYVLVQMLSFSLEDGVRRDKVICLVIIPQKRYILLKCVFVE